MQGSVLVADSSIELGQEACVGQTIVVGELSRAAIRLYDTQTVIRIQQNSEFIIEPTSPGNSLLRLLAGVMHLFSRRPETLNVSTPYINAAIDGTEFVISADEGESTVTVIEGAVLASNSLGKVRTVSGELAIARAHEAPQRKAVVNPMDAVQWALYYPPISQSEQTTDATRRAAELLSVGDFKQALGLLRGGTEDAVSLGLRALIAVALNRNEEALELARQSVQRDTSSSVAYTALSYAQQASFDIESALKSAESAVGNGPTDPYALARLAELQLGVGRTQAALESAQAALRVGPTVSRAQTVLGFVYLVRLDVDRAQSAFENAIELDQSDPLARLGLGLAVVRDGNLVAGREHIEAAASLDPNNALIRSYLGKAYFEERNVAEAVAQLELAKGFDPRDPTPWLYEAILLQSLNQPVDAFENLTTATSLNDNTLVYRSRALLDKSAAAASLGLASIYADLGFQQLAINEGSRSITKDPTNFAAYRFLADSYAGRERHESARRNILFQSTLLQPLTISPVQPEARETDLRIAPGANPSDPSVNEYTPLFDGDGLQLSGSLLGGNRGTFGDQLVLSGLGDKMAFSLGQFHYQTDGFRENADVEHDLYSVLVQAQPNPDLTVQAEYHDRQTEQGDLRLNFNPDDFSPTFRMEVKSETPRLGVRYHPGPRSTVLMSVLGLNVEESELLPVGPADTLASSLTEQGLSVLGQFTYQGDTWNHTIGADLYDMDVKLFREFNPCSREPCQIDNQSSASNYGDAYYYIDGSSNKSLEWRVGINYSMIDDEAFKIDEKVVGPRLGVRWEVSQSLSLRLAIAKGVRKRKVADLTMEPIVLAGFNQLYDDLGGTRYLNTGVGMDWHFDRSTTIGVEALHRDLEVPKLLTVETAGGADTVRQDEPQKEATIRAYWYHIVNKRFSLGLDLLVERFSRDNFFDAQGQPISAAPLEVDTITVPISASFFDPSGLFLKGRISYVTQNLEFLPPPDTSPEAAQIFNEDYETFTSVDLTVGYRLPSLQGDFRLVVNNLLDENFLYQDQNIQSGNPGNPRYSPGRAFFAGLSVNF